MRGVVEAGGENSPVIRLSVLLISVSFSMPAFGQEPPLNQVRKSVACTLFTFYLGTGQVAR